MTYMDQFKGYLIDTGKSLHTIKSYLSDLKQFEIWLQGTYGETELSPNSITKLDITHYKSHMLSVLGRKPSGINRALSSISAFCEWMKSQSLLKDNPVDQIPQAKQIKSPPKALSTVEKNRLIRSVEKARNKRDFAMIQLMLNAGLRISEVVGLKLIDIERTNGKWFATVRLGKGLKYRQIPLNSDVKKALEEYLPERDSNSDYLFTSQKGGGLSSNALWRVIKKYGDQAGLEDLTPHALRHTFGSMLVRDKRVDIVTVASLMGHESIQTTAIYTKPNEKDMIDAVEKLAEW